MDGWHEPKRIVCDACHARDDDPEPLQPGELRYVQLSAQ